MYPDVASTTNLLSGSQGHIRSAEITNELCVKTLNMQSRLLVVAFQDHRNDNERCASRVSDQEDVVHIQNGRFVVVSS